MSRTTRSDTVIDWRMVLACLAVVIAIIVSLLVPAPSIPTAQAATIPPLTIDPPAIHDHMLTRSMTIHLDNAGVSSYEYGWSNSGTVPPSGPYQEVTDANHATLDFRPTTPDSLWFLWVRSVLQDGTRTSWSRPVKVHTPPAPSWVGVGDSYSSGHHQDSDEPYCPRLVDAKGSTVGRTIAELCNKGHGPADIYTESPSFSWVTAAAANLTAIEALPPAWAIHAYVLARSGTTTDEMLTKQVPAMARLLKARSSSWNTLSITGGADDAGFGEPLASFYAKHWTGFNAPWALQNADDCPDTRPVYDWLMDNSWLIALNIGRIIQRAIIADQFVHILKVGYAYTVDSTNVCFNDNGSIPGVKSTVDFVNTMLAPNTGLQLRYVDLTQANSLGPNPVADGYIQRTRFYGYPHPSADGQSRIATTVADLASTIS